MEADTRQDMWEASYGRGENLVFYPSDEVVRFLARHVRKRIGFDRFLDIAPGAAGAKILDAGCGIGRNLLLGLDLGLDPYGSDHSQAAVSLAREALARRGVANPEQRAVRSDIRQLPWSDGFFDHAISEAVLDSMAFAIARPGLMEIGRVLRQGGWFYCSLISGDETGHPADFADEVVVRQRHEQDTVQSYFDQAKIARLMEGVMEVVSCWHVRHHETVGNRRHSRWHVVCRRC